MTNVTPLRANAADSAGGLEVVFEMLFDIARDMFDDAGVHGYAVVKKGRAMVPAGSFGSRLGLDVMQGHDEVVRKLGGRLDEQQRMFVNLEPDVGVVVQRLVVDGRIVGGVLIAAKTLKKADLKKLDAAFKMAAYTLELELERIVTTQILDAIDATDDAISIYDEDGAVVFTNAAYHRVFPHYPSQGRILGMTHIELCRLDLQMGVIEDETARTNPCAYLMERIARNTALKSRSREIQKFKGRSYLYTRARAQSGSTMSRRVDVTDLKDFAAAPIAAVATA